MKVGFLSTWNQRCGLATYLEAIIKHLGTLEYSIFAEAVAPADIVSVDGPEVVRCWKRWAADMQQTLTAIRNSGIEILHINCQHTFFHPTVLAEFLKAVREQGIAIVAHVHNPMTIAPELQALIGGCDRIFVHTPENKLELLANGATPEQVVVHEIGIELVSHMTQAAARRSLGIDLDQRVVVTQGFLRKHKGIHSVINAIGLLHNEGIAVHYYVLGSLHHEDADGNAYLNALHNLTKQLGIEHLVHFETSFLPNERVHCYLQAADAAVYAYESNFFEASATLSAALGTGSAVITSTAPTFARYGETVFHATTGFPLALAIHSVLAKPDLQKTLRSNALTWAKQYCWQNVITVIQATYRQLKPIIRTTPSTSQSPIQTATSSATIAATSIASRPEMRVVFLARDTIFSAPGGDSVVFKKLLEGLPLLGVSVEVDITGRASLDNYDIAHIFNYSIPDQIQRNADRCIAAGLPYVVTPFYEDWGQFIIPLNEVSIALATYINKGQPKHEWINLYNFPKDITLPIPFDLSYATNRAAGIIVSGSAEAERFKSNYPLTKNIFHYHTGADQLPLTVDRDRFRKEQGIGEYILCVGRLESRKNQLMLLKALEDSDLTLVFLTGGVVDGSTYDVVCKSFKRKGKTIFLDRIDAELLASAYAGASVHVLPSWCELPGLVTLEAARFGTPVVATDYGTIRDYLGELCIYADPTEEGSIREAIEVARRVGNNPALAARAQAWTWSNCIKESKAIYEKALGRTKNTTPSREAILDLLR